MSHVLPNISRGRFFEPIFTSKKFDLYRSIYGMLRAILGIFQDQVFLLFLILDYYLNNIHVNRDAKVGELVGV